MSNVTDVFLCCCVEESAALENVNKWLGQKGFGLLAQADPVAFGGPKHAAHDVWCAALNHLDRDGFAEAVTDAPWLYPEAVVVVTYRDEGATTVILVPRRPTVQHSPWA